LPEQTRAPSRTNWGKPGASRRERGRERRWRFVSGIGVHACPCADIAMCGVLQNPLDSTRAEAFGAPRYPPAIYAGRERAPKAICDRLTARLSLFDVCT